MNSLVPASPSDSDANGGPSGESGAPNLIWRVELFAGLRARRLDRPDLAPLDALPPRSAALLAFLALDRRHHKREAVTEAFWPDANLHAARNRLRVSLSSLRAILEPEAALKGQILIADKETLGLNRVSTDLEAFRARLRESELGREEKSRLALLEAALALVGGPLLHGFYEDWALQSAGNFENEVLRVARQIMVRREAQGDVLAALNAARRANAIAPHQISTMSEVVRLALRAGQEERARNEFETWQRRISAEGWSESLPTWKQMLARARPQTAPRPGTVAAVGTVPDPTPASVPLAPFAPSALPISLTTFVGRHAQRATLDALLGDERVRLISVLGTGGIGKTRFALETAREIRVRASKTATIQESEFFGVAWVALAHLPSPRLIGGAILDALGLARGDESIETVAGVLNEFCERERGRLLLILDNFEPFCENGAPWVKAILTRAPRVVILTTSRSVLGLEGERPLFLAPLQCERRSVKRVAAQNRPAGPSRDWPDGARLFVERARVARPDFSLDCENLGAVVELCERLGGLPLAIEIAAARCALWHPAQLLEALERESSARAEDFGANDQENSLFNWPNPVVDAAPRQRNLRVAIDWSVRQLPAQAAHFWAQASVFRGGFSLDAATQICEEKRAPTLILALRDCSLLALDARPPTPRALWSETLREFAWRRLNFEQQADLQARHAAYFLELAEKNGPHDFQSLELENERPNLRAAFDWFLQNDANGALRMAAALWWHWEQSGRIVEGRAALQAALSADTGPPDFEAPQEEETANWRAAWRLRGRVEEGAGKLANVAADLEVAAAHLRRAQAAFERAGDPSGVAACLYGLGFNALQSGEIGRARQLCEASVTLARTQNQPDLLGDALYNLTLVVLLDGDFGRAREISGEVLGCHQVAENGRGVALALENLGLCALLSGETGAARAFFERAMANFETLNEKPSLARALWGLGHVARAQNAPSEAARHFARALQLSHNAQNSWALPYLVEAFALLASDAGQWVRAAQLLGAAAQWRKKYRSPLPHAILSAALQGASAQACAQLGAARFGCEWQVGQSLTRDEMCLLALNSSD